MSFHPTILNQILNHIDRLEFKSYVKVLESDKNVKSITSEKLLKLNIFAQLADVKSMRHLQYIYNLETKLHYHFGCKKISLNGISYAMANRSSEPFRQLFYSLQQEIKRHQLSIGKKFKKYVSIVDSTSMPFSGDGSDWAQAGKSRREAKAHCLIDASGMPLDMVISGASMHDSRGLRKLNLGKTEVIVMDRAYYGYNLWKDLCDKGLTFITRAKSNMQFKVVSKRNGRKPKDVVSDENIFFYNNRTNRKNKMLLRRIEIKTHNGRIAFITNDLDSKANIVTDLYKSRWEIELFFKCIKQTLKIKRFMGRNKNAIEIQLWVAMIVYLILFLIKNMSKFKGKFIELIRLVRAKLTERVNLYDLLNPDILDTYMNHMQPSLFKSSGH